MHRSRLGNLVIDCNSDDLLAEARFWSEALGYPLPEMIDDDSPFIQLRTPPGEVQLIIQRVSHEARAHLDIDTDSIPDEVAPGTAGCHGCHPQRGLGSDAGPQRSPLLRRQPLSHRFRRARQPLARMSAD